MFLQKLIPKFIYVSVLLLTISFIVPNYVLAEMASVPNPIDAAQCPINGFVEIGLNASLLDVEDNFSQSVKLGNYSNFTLSEIKIAVAVFESDEEVVPKYWTVLKDSYQLSPNQEFDVPINLDLTALSAGEFNLKIFAIQGDETAALGTILLQGQKDNFIKINKISEAKSNIEVAIVTDTEKQSAGAIYANITTTNKNKVPLFESKLLAVVTQGNIPLGTAVWSSQIDGVKLIPNGHRLTKIQNDLAVSGLYTIYAGLISEGILQPVEKKTIQIGEVSEDLSWSYLSKIGLSEYPLKNNSEVVVCVGNIGKDENYDRFVEPLALNLTLKEQSGKTATEKLLSTNTGNNNYFSYKVNNIFQNFELSLDLFHQRFPTNVAKEGEFAVEDNLSKLETIRQTFKCDNTEICSLNSVSESSDIPQEQKSFWFYAGIIIAAALLLYLMLRRLEPYHEDEGHKLSKYELH